MSGTTSPGRAPKNSTAGGALRLDALWTCQVLAAAQAKVLGEIDLAVAFAAQEALCGAPQPVVALETLTHLVGGGGDTRRSEPVRRSLRRLHRLGVLSIQRLGFADDGAQSTRYRIVVPQTVENFTFDVTPGWQMHRSLHQTRRRWFLVGRRHLRWALREGTDGLKSRVGVLLALSHRCLFLKGSTLSNQGRSKARELAALLGISKRTVDTRRKELERVGILEKVPVSIGNLRAWGECYRFNLAWAGTQRERGAAQSAQTATLEAPNRAQTATRNQSPLSLRERVKNQSPRGKSGFYRTNSGKRFPHIAAESLTTFSARMRLFEQLVALGWLEDSIPKRAEFEGSFQNARAHGHNAAAVLAWRIQREKLGWCTDAAEASVYERVKAYLRPVIRSVAEAVGSTRKLPTLEGDTAVLHRHRGKRPRLWTEERFQLARLHLANWQLKLQRAQSGVDEPSAFSSAGTLSPAFA